jgi:predicted cupin superfamily sugar epimerase
MMNKPLQELIKNLELLPHPEGGFYKEIYRSNETIPGKDRDLLTSIYFLLTSENVSRFHRIKSDELWYFHFGSAVTVHTLDEKGHTQNLLGNNFEKGEQPFLLVKSDTIFGSSIEEKGGFALVSCAVAPGFDFRDFELFSRDELLTQYPNHSEIIHRLT